MPAELEPTARGRRRAWPAQGSRRLSSAPRARGEATADVTRDEGDGGQEGAGGEA